MATNCPKYLHLKAAFFALEPASIAISIARQACGGSLTEEVQNFILELCVENSACIENYCNISCNHIYVMNILKRVIIEAESSFDIVVEGLYELYAKIALQERVVRTVKNKVLKKISFLFPFGTDHFNSQKNLVASLQCSYNLLEGDTGCALWPSSLYLSEFILSYPKLFLNKVCFEIGSGVGLIGVVLAHVGSSKIILSDGDMSSLENMRKNLNLNHLTSQKVQSYYLQWDSATENEFSKCKHDCILGADIIYDPKYVPHLIRVLRILLEGKRNECRNPLIGDTQYRNSRHVQEEKASVAYIATVIRNNETFNLFLLQAQEAQLCVVDITENWQPLNLLPYLLTYDRATVSN